MRRIVFYAFLWANLIITSAFAEIQIAFTPSDDCEKKIIDLIDKCSKRIDIAVYSINNQQIVDALFRAHTRNVELRILTDRSQAGNKNSKVVEMHDKGLNIRVHSKNKTAHNKFAIFDGESVSAGSYNWTNAASNKNNEDCLFLIKEPDNVKVYQERFEELWRHNSSKKSENWFEKRKSKNDH